MRFFATLLVFGLCVGSLFFVSSNEQILLSFSKNPTVMRAAHSPESQERANKQKKYYNLVPILCFHNIDGKGPYSLSRHEFRHYLERIRDSKVQVIPLRLLLEHAKRRRLMQEPSLVITIDDDYKNIARVAAPLLREFGYPATFFFYIQGIFKSPKSGTSWEDLRRLYKQGFEIQSHSYSHTAFHKAHPGESPRDWKKRVRKEIFVSRTILEKKVPGLQIYAFAYPMGYHTQALEEQLRRYGYQVALTTDAKPVDLSRPFSFVFDRYTVQKKYVKDPVKMFERQILYAKHIYKKD